MLQKARCKHKILGQQLTNLPQIDLLLLHIIKTVTNQSDLRIQRNASIIQTKIKENFGFQFQFLNNQTFVFQGEFVVDIRCFNQSCQCYIRHQKLEVVNKIKMDIMLQQSAHFLAQKEGQLCGSQQTARKNAKKVKVTKKSTIKSIQWMEQTSQEVNQLQQKEGQNPESTEEIKLPPFLEQIPFAHKREYSTIQNVKTKRLGLDIKRFQLYNQQKHNFGLNFSDNFTSSLQNIKISKHQPRNINLQTNKRGGFHNIVGNKSFLGGSYGDSFMKTQIISTSHSTKCIKSDGLTMSKISGQQIRIPTFILNRARAKRQLEGRHSQKSQDLSRPKITFVYKNK